LTDNNENTRERLAGLYDRAVDDDKRETYARWAETYDSDLQQVLGYKAPLHAAELLASVAKDPAAAVLDFGCGTGLVAEQLVTRGYTHLIGLDNSPEMLQVANGKNYYRELHCVDLTTEFKVQLPPASCGICVGVFGFGPVWESHIPAMFSALEDGAPLIATVNGKAWQDHNWAERLERVENEIGVAIEFMKTIEYLPEEQIEGRLLLLRRND